MIKWGIIGLGNMAHKFASSIGETNNSKLVGVASLSKNKLNSFKKNFQIDENNVYSNYDDLISSKNVDAIYIATLNNTHLENIKKCAKNKKNILCEKPFALNYKEAKIAYDSIENNGINFYEAFAYRTHNQTKIIKEVIDQNEIGEIISIKANFGFKIKKIKPKSRLFNKQLGGGCILDIGCYPLSFLNFLFNNKYNYEISNAKASFAITEVDDHAQADIIIDNSINCFVNVSFKENLDNKIQIKGSKGEIVVNEPWLPDKKSILDIKFGNSFYKKFINSKLNIYANQIQKISENFENKTKSDKFAVDILDSLHITKNLSLWSSLIKDR